MVTCCIVLHHSGIGYETALHFARLNPAKLILAVRNVQAGQAAALKIATTTGCKEVEVWNLDLGDLKNTKAFGLRAQKELERLDVVVSLQMMRRGDDEERLETQLYPLASRDHRYPMPGWL